MQPYHAQDDTLWWEEGVVQFATNYYQDQMQMRSYTSWESRTDCLDVQACCNVFEAHWNNLFSHMVSKKARSWNKLVKDVRNDIAHIGAGDYPEADTTSALDNIARLAGEMDQETMEEIQALYRTHVYGSAGGSTATTTQAAPEPVAKKPVGVMQSTPVTGLPSWREVILSPIATSSLSVRCCPKC